MAASIAFSSLFIGIPMTQSSDFAQQSPEQRLNFLIKQANQQQQIWILTDEHGCVMLNSEDEDCAPVWPSQETAQAWATGEWSECNAMAIDLKTWFAKWTDGLEQDQVCVAVFPSHDQDGIVLTPEEFEFELKNKKLTGH